MYAKINLTSITSKILLRRKPVDDVTNMFLSFRKPRTLAPAKTVSRKQRVYRIGVDHEYEGDFTEMSKHSWVYQDAKEMERLTAKLVISSKELWAPTPNLSWLLNIYPPNTRKHPLLCDIVPRVIRSLLVLLGVQRRKQTP